MIERIIGKTIISWTDQGAELRQRGIDTHLQEVVWVDGSQGYGSEIRVQKQYWSKKSI